MNNNDLILSDEKIESIKSELNSIIKELDNLIPDDTPDEPYYEPEYDPELEYYNSQQGRIGDLYNRKQTLEEVLYRDSYAKKANEYQALYITHIDNYSSGKILSDNVTAEDIFNRKETAKTIANTLCNPSTSSPFNVGILGKWGQGKTTFIKYIQEGIYQNLNASNIHIINFNASEYSSQEQIWANIASKLFKAFEKEQSFAKLKFSLAKICNNKSDYIAKILINLMIIILLFIIAFATKFTFSFKNLLGYFASFGIGLSGIILLISKIVIPFFKSSISSSIPLSNKIIGKMKLPSYTDTLGARAQISSDINILLSAWIPKSEERIIIFVDELDRCSEKGIVEFFESIQLLITTPKLFFVFAIDPVQLNKAINAHYKPGGFSTSDFTNDYLDKYIAVTIPLHNNVKYSIYVESLINELTPSNNTYCFSEGEIETIKTYIDMIPSDKLTPRKVKKTINALLLLKEYCVTTINTISAIDFRELTAWFIFSSVYRKESTFIVELFDPKREYTPLENIINFSHQKTIHENPNAEVFINKMGSFRMHNILIYNKLSIMLSINNH